MQELHNAIDIFAANNFVVSHDRVNNTSTVFDTNTQKAVTLHSYVMGMIQEAVYHHATPVEQEEVDKQYGNDDGYGEHVNYPSY